MRDFHVYIKKKVSLGERILTCQALSAIIQLTPHNLESICVHLDVAKIFVVSGREVHCQQHEVRRQTRLPGRPG